MIRKARRPKAASRGVSAKAVGKIALALPGIAPGMYYGFPAFMAGKKCLTRVRDEDGICVVHIGSFTDRDLLIAADPRAFFTTAHYQNYPIVLVRLEHVVADQLRGILTDAATRLQEAPARRRVLATGS
ncbi:MAG: hypothetical protein ACKVS7_03740 [Gemmatimonadaceae bacterium]